MRLIGLQGQKIKKKWEPSHIKVRLRSTDSLVQRGCGFSTGLFFFKVMSGSADRAAYLHSMVV
jgi:hypothetical protein